jgi:hypothetical protein
MEVSISSHRYGSGGSSPIYTVIGDLLMTRLGIYGSAIELIEIEVSLRTNSKKEKRNEEYQEFLNGMSNRSRGPFETKPKSSDLKRKTQYQLACAMKRPSHSHSPQSSVVANVQMKSLKSHLLDLIDSTS